jgi:outer membrane protein assembly factor BamE
MKRLALRMILLTASALAATGCVYRMAIQQGNYLVTDSVSQLKEGMTRSQVRFLLGTPMVPVAFNDDRWDYYYFFKSRHFKEPLKRRLTVYFADGKVARYENDGVPTQTDLDQMNRDLKKALAETKKTDRQRQGGFFKRHFGRDKTDESTEPAGGTAGSTSSEKNADPKSEAQKPPDPVPPSQPLPAPAGTPSGPT